MQPISPEHRLEAAEELEDIALCLTSMATFTYEDLAQRLDGLLQCVEVWSPTNGIENDEPDYPEQNTERNGVQSCLRQTVKHH